MAAGYYLNSQSEGDLVAAVLLGISKDTPSLEQMETADNILSGLIDVGLVDAYAGPATLDFWSQGEVEEDDVNVYTFATLGRFYRDYDGET